MRVWAEAAALGCALSASAPALAIDPFFPEFGNRRIDVDHYALDLSVTPRPSRLEATATLTVVALDDLDAFRLDLSGLDVSSVRVNGTPAEFRQKDGKLAVRPKARIAAGDAFEVVVAYAGAPKPIEDPTDPAYRLGWFAFRGGTYVVSEPVGASTFFPANDEPTDKATFSFAVTVPDGYEAVANGVLEGAGRVAGGRRFVWRMDQPMTTWLATVQVNRYALLKTSTAGGLPLRIYTTAGAGPDDDERYARAKAMIPFIETIAGPYPFESYGSVTVDDPILNYALETQAMSTFPSGAADEGLVAHELAHQWFGNAVSVRRWADIWLAEGYATYFETLWPNRRNAADFNRAMRGLYDFAVDRKLGPAVVEDGTQIFSDRVYVRGALTLYALRLKIGPQAFNAVTRAFVDRFRGGNATSKDFIRTAVEVSGDGSVRELLRAWLYDQPVPPLPGDDAGAARRRSGPVPRPALVGLGCGRGAHRGAPAVCPGNGAPGAD